MRATTRKLYLEGTYLFQCTAQVASIGAASVSGKPDDPTKPFVVLDQTVCHPQGGGQPSDAATLTTASGAVFHVTDVRTDRDRLQVLHFGTPVAPATVESFAVGTAVTVQLEEATRRHHARLHSAGHLLDSALSQLGVLKQYGLKPTKGYHFPSGPNVEYTGIIPPGDINKVQTMLQEQMDKLVQEDAAVEVFMDVPMNKVAEVCCTTDFEPEEGKPQDERPEGVRVVRMVGLGCPCGGTHVERLGEIGKVIITKIKCAAKKSEVKVSYQLA